MTTVINIPPEVRTILETLEQEGFEAWLVGGCVRDALLGRTCNDYDLTTNAPWTETARLFRERGFAVIETGTQHGTVTIRINHANFEITTYRTDGTYSDGRHPDTVQPAQSIEEDLLRRDFTINALAYHPARGLLDKVGGVQDLNAGRIACVGDPNKRFHEDALRIMRALRFASKLGFSIEGETARAIHQCLPLLDYVSAERIKTELDGILLGEQVAYVLIEYVDVITHLIPQFKATVGFDQRTPYHIYTVYEHIAHAVEHAPFDLRARWVAFLHDVGKPPCFSVDENGRGHFYGHAAVSAHMAEGIFKRFHFPNAFADDCVQLIARHDDVIEETPRAVKRVLGKLDGRMDLFEALCDMKIADALSQSDLCANRVAHANNLKTIAAKIRESDEAFSLKALTVNGNDLLAQGMRPGKNIGDALDTLLGLVIEEALPNEKSALLRYVQENMTDGTLIMDKIR